MVQQVFRREADEYKTYINPVEDYIHQVSNLMSEKHKISYEEAVVLVKECIKESSPRNPTIRYHCKNSNGDMEVTENKLTTYISDVRKSGNIIVPSFTIYRHPDQERSLHADYLSYNIAKRKEDKHKAFEFERLGDEPMFRYYNTLQSSRKVKNNSLSGAYASPSTILYNPSAHFTLTSITRCVSGIGNALSETIVGGNKYFDRPNAVTGYIATICAYVDKEKVRSMIEKYNLHIPTPLEVFESIKRISRWYWRDSKQEAYILHILENIDPISRAAFLYINDLWNIKNYNETFMRTLIGRMSLKVEEGSTDYLSDLDNSIDGVNMLAHHIYASEIKGKEIIYKEMLKENDPLLGKIASTAKNIKETLMEYRDFFHTFFVTDILPINVAYLKDMYRFNIVLSDTDSTCCSYDKWVDWFFGRHNTGDDGIAVAASVMTITTQLTDHCLRIFSKNMNTGIQRSDYLKMKNEFYWQAFITANVTKHYYASTLIKEGNVYKTPKREKKGVHFISSTIGGDLISRSEALMDRLMEEAIAGKKISVVDACREVADLERRLLNDFHNGELYMFRKDSIKGAKSYKDGPEKSKYVNHILWKDVFEEYYNGSIEPPYGVYNIPLKVGNKSDWVEVLTQIERVNPKMKLDLTLFCTKYKKERISTFRPPKSMSDAKGLPKEIIPHVDIRKTIMQALTAFYFILETIGYYKKPGYLLMELGF